MMNDENQTYITSQANTKSRPNLPLLRCTLLRTIGRGIFAAEVAPTLTSHMRACVWILIIPPPLEKTQKTGLRNTKLFIDDDADRKQKMLDDTIRIVRLSHHLLGQ
ncbi:unnamed protein product [Ectocarpus sp. 12 AP-2014]